VTDVGSGPGAGTGSGEPLSTTAAARPLEGRVTGALLVGLASLGLPWGAAGAPGYTTEVRVPVVVAGLLVHYGWRRRSRRLVRVGMVSAVVALMLAHLVGGGAIALAIALVLLELALRRTP
jgi:hypothetical protein